MLALRAAERLVDWAGLSSLENKQGRKSGSTSIISALGMFRRIGCSLNKLQDEIWRLSDESRRIAADITAFAATQAKQAALDPEKKTIFMTVTCGQAVRNFLLSRTFELLVERYNLVILSPFAYSDAFRRTYGSPGVHILPWFESFRSTAERMFQYYFMRRSGSRTHQGWLTNLERRARTATEQRHRFLKHYILLRLSEVIGSVVGRRAMQALYHAYFLSYLPGSLFKHLFSTYKPALVLSTTAHHVEAWPLTYFGRRYDTKTVANILSWDNTTTKPALDTSCDYYTVWSSEMKEEFARHHPYVQTSLVVTGSPLFDMYYNRGSAMDRATFLAGLGLSPDRPYVLWTTNTPSGMPDEHEIIQLYWEALHRSPLADKISLLVRLHPKEDQDRYSFLGRLDHVALTCAGSPYWNSSDRWLPSRADMQLLLNSMLHAAVSVNVASTMSLESFALNLPTINVAFKSRSTRQDHNLMWSFEMYHTSEHYRAIVNNGAVAVARNLDELVEHTISALKHPDRRQSAMRQTLEQKAAHCDGTSARHFVNALAEVLEGSPNCAPPKLVASAVVNNPGASTYESPVLR